MTQTLQIGPLALPYALLVAMAAIALGWLVGKRLGRSAGLDAEPLLLRMLLAGWVAARLAFVWQWRGPYLGDPLSVLDIRDGGWDATAGMVAACLYGLYRVGRQRALRKPMVAAVLTAGTAWVLGAFALLVWPGQAAALPPLSLSSLEGQPISVPGFAGKPTVLNLWATWCPPCQREMPLLQQAQAADVGVNYVFINQGEMPQAITRYLDRHQLRLQNVLVDARLQAGAALGQRALPTTLFFDARGQLVSTRIGELSSATLAQRLSELRTTAPPSEPPPPH